MFKAKAVCRNTAWDTLLLSPLFLFTFTLQLFHSCFHFQSPLPFPCVHYWKKLARWNILIWKHIGRWYGSVVYHCWSWLDQAQVETCKEMGKFLDTVVCCATGLWQLSVYNQLAILYWLWGLCLLVAHVGLTWLCKRITLSIGSVGSKAVSTEFDQKTTFMPVTLCSANFKSSLASVSHRNSAFWHWTSRQLP